MSDYLTLVKIMLKFKHNEHTTEKGIITQSE